MDSGEDPDGNQVEEDKESSSGEFCNIPEIHNFVRIEYALLAIKVKSHMVL